MKSDCLLDYMLLDESGKIIAMDFCGSEKYSRDIEPSFSLRFYRSLHKGDRTLLTKFCQEKFDPQAPAFNLYNIVNFCGYSYLFVEKVLFDGNIVNIALFGNSIYDFKPLLSPDTVHYGCAVGRIIYDILYTAPLFESKKEEKRTLSPLERDGYLVRSLIKPTPRIDNYITPEALLHISKAPQLADELRRKTNSLQNCDVYCYTQTIVKNIKESGLCEKTDISIISSADREEKRIFPIRAVPYVHVMVSIIHILSSLSRDGKINISLNFYDSGAAASISTFAFPKYKFISDTTDFSELAAANKNITYTSALLMLLADELGFTPIIRFDKIGNRLSISVKLTESDEGCVEFRYNDPYEGISDILSEAAALLGLGEAHG